MAAIFRVKRRRTEDPVEALIVCCKKIKHDTEVQSEDLGGIVKFAFTVPSKDVDIAAPIRNAIRKEKLEKEYKHHMPNIAYKVRQHRQKASIANRYKILNSHRDIALDHLGKASVVENVLCDKQSEEICDNQASVNSSVGLRTSETSETNGCSSNDSQSSKLDQMTSSKLDEMTTDCDNSNSQAALKEMKEVNGSSNSTSCGPTTHNNKMFCLYEVEQHTDAESQQSESSVTCNNIPMKSEKIKGEDEFVYDLYYTNNASVDFRSLELDLMIEAVGGDYLCDERNNDCDVDYLYDEDDSNDEDNWRNDYPDEDPGFYDNNQDPDIFYPDESTAYPHYYREDDQLADWMSTRCNIEGDESLSSSEESDYGSRSRTYSAYYTKIKKEMDSYKT